jgi:hypothetical protein
VSPVQHRRRLDSLLAALRNLAGRGLTAATVLAFLHHRRVVPLMERPLRMFEMTETANPVSLARSRMLQSPPPAGVRGYTGAECRRHPVPAQRPVPVGPRDASHRPAGE